MTEKPDKKRWGWKRRTAISVAIAVLYVLSRGPAARVIDWERGPLKNVFFGFYTPVFFPSLKSETYKGVLFWYLTLWGVKP
jgi:hypothetical protein